MSKSLLAKPEALRPSLWNRHIAFGRWVIHISLRQQIAVQRYQPVPRISNRLATLRAEHTISRQELARLLSVSEQTLKAIECDRYMPSLELAFRISMFFGVPIEAVFSYSGIQQQYSHKEHSHEAIFDV